ncbi:MAG TPA: hypothetical protein VN805_14070 [Caulobacteraceae bacterium]|nr:hypothetical protein [Caulobacteraceae bacterium]
MPLPKDAVAELARRLDEAERTKRRIGQISKAFPDMTADDAYAVHEAWISNKLSRGRRMVGHKIGLTSRAMQTNAQIDEPDYGVLLDDMVFADGAEVPAARFIAPMGATDDVAPALEVIDLRVQPVDPETRTTMKGLGSISDNAACAGSPGSPTSSQRTAWSFRPAKSCYAALSLVRSRRAQATCSTPTTAPSGASPFGFPADTRCNVRFPP